MYKTIKSLTTIFCKLIGLLWGLFLHNKLYFKLFSNKGHKFISYVIKNIYSRLKACWNKY